MEAHRSSKLLVVLKTFLALLAGAVVAALVVTALALRASVAADGAPDGLSGLLSDGAVTFAIALVFTAAHVFILGLPLLLLGVRLRLLRWWSVLLVAFLIGFIPSSLIVPSAVPATLAMGALGMIGGLAFWLVWRFWVQPASGGGSRPLPAEPAKPNAADPSTGA